MDQSRSQTFLKSGVVGTPPYDHTDGFDLGYSGEEKWRGIISTHTEISLSLFWKSLQHQHRPGSAPGLYSACPCPAQGWQHCLCLYCSTEGMPGLIHMEGWEGNWTGRSRSGIWSHRCFRGPPDRVKQPVLIHSWITESLHWQGLHTCPPLSLWV